MPLLSAETEKRVVLMFPPSEHGQVRALLLEQCGNNLPGLEGADSATLDRFRFAALKVSGGNLAKLHRAVQLARTDWRDLLMAAGFGESLTAHESWLPK